MDTHFPMAKFIYFSVGAGRERRTRVATRTKDGHFLAETVAKFSDGVTDLDVKKLMLLLAFRLELVSRSLHTIAAPLFFELVRTQFSVLQYCQWCIIAFDFCNGSCACFCSDEELIVICSMALSLNLAACCGLSAKNTSTSRCLILSQGSVKISTGVHVVWDRFQCPRTAVGQI